MGSYVGESFGDYYRAGLLKGDTRSFDYSSYGVSGFKGVGV